MMVHYSNLVEFGMSVVVGSCHEGKTWPELSANIA